jgi:transposase
MTLHPHSIGPVPEETARIAHAASPKSIPICTCVTCWVPSMTISYLQPFFLPWTTSSRPWRLALITIMQFAGGLSDWQTAEAVRIRIDWKYALHVELSDPGFDFSVLCEFRARLLGGHAKQLLLETMLDQFKTHGLRDPRVGTNAP